MESGTEDSAAGSLAGQVEAISVSSGRGTGKMPVDCAVLRENWGLEGDAHAGHWHRQVSILPAEKIREFGEKVPGLSYGSFGENLAVSGLDLKALPVGSRLRIGECLLEVSQVGKACHAHCAIFERAGDCIMPREGIFAVVLRGGTVRIKDAVRVLPPDPERPFTAAVITLSDRAAAGIYEDKSGPLICGILSQNGYQIVETLLLPDGRETLVQELKRLSDQRQVNVIFTTGGTGFGPRDETPEATAEVCSRMADGITQAILYKSLDITPNAMLSRQRAGIRKRTLIINLPGSPKACREDLEIVLPALKHGLGVLRGSEDG